MFLVLKLKSNFIPKNVTPKQSKNIFKMNGTMAYEWVIILIVNRPLLALVWQILLLLLLLFLNLLPFRELGLAVGLHSQPQDSPYNPGAYAGYACIIGT